MTPAPAPESAALDPAAGAPAGDVGHRRDEFTVWGGLAFEASTLLGGLTRQEARDRRTLMLALRYGRLLGVMDGLAVRYVVEVIPVEFAVNSVVGAPRGRADVYGAGINPLGFSVTARCGSVGTFLGLSGGMIIFGDEVPLPGTRRLNFTADAAGGIAIAISDDRTLELGVRLHHISNGWRASVNRGLNSVLVYAGLSVFR